MYRAYVSLGEYETLEQATRAIELAEQLGDDTLIKEVKGEI